MVDTEKIKARGTKALFVGAGAFGSAFLSDLVEDFLGFGGLVNDVSLIAIGTGASVYADEAFPALDALPNNAVEFAGYGVAGEGFSSLGESLSDRVQTGAPLGASRVVNAEVDASEVATAEVEENSHGDFALDNA